MLRKFLVCIWVATLFTKRINAGCRSKLEKVEGNEFSFGHFKIRCL